MVLVSRGLCQQQPASVPHALKFLRVPTTAVNVARASVGYLHILTARIQRAQR